MKETKQIWISKGYDTFARKGLAELKIQTLAKDVGISKSSFYHLFFDLDHFVDQLITYHLVQAKQIAKLELECKSIDPELIHILIQHKMDLLFNRQLRVQRELIRFEQIINESTQIIAESFLIVWEKNLSKTINQVELQKLFQLALDNFFLKITYENLNYNWLSEYFKELNSLTSNFANN